MLDISLLLPERPRPLKRSEYDRLVALGAFEDERIELLHGVLVDMSPNHPEHVSPIDFLTMTLAPALKGRAIVRIQSPIVAHDESEPEPDVAVVPIADYRHAHPEYADLIVEVAVSSLKKDREIKTPLYAVSGFREYWIVNVPERCVEVCRTPSETGFASITTHREGDLISPEAFPDVQIRVADLFG